MGEGPVQGGPAESDGCGPGGAVAEEEKPMTTAQPRRKKTQAENYHLAMAGEYYVAAELHRRGIQAAVTHGNAKRADVVAFLPGGGSVMVEVKSTQGSGWVVGRVPERRADPWVFVRVPAPSEQVGPTFYVVPQSAIHDILAPMEDERRRTFMERRGREPKPPVWSLTREQVEPFLGQWKHIVGGGG